MSDDLDSIIPPPDDSALWAAAREMFVDQDLTGKEVCEALGLAEATFWKRARDESWLRRDREPPAVAAFDPEAPPPDPAQTVETAWRRAVFAMNAGRSAEATRWMRLHAQFQAAAEHAARQAARQVERRLRQENLESDREFNREMSDLQTKVRAAYETFKPARTPAGVEKRESISSDSRPTAPLDPNAPGLDRAERRRRLKLMAKTRARPP